MENLAHYYHNIINYFQYIYNYIQKTQFLLPLDEIMSNNNIDTN